MNELWDGLTKAIELLITLDSEVMQIAGRSLQFAAISSALASLICLPLGSLIHFYQFPGKRILVSMIQTLYSFPTVGIGLFVFVFISSSGPLGDLELLFTPTAIIIGQMTLISPILLGLTISALSGVNTSIKDTALSLGANDRQAMVVVLKEARFAVVAALVVGFGRAISEVGVSMMVGGNIRGFTRVLTTAIALETSRGELELSIALGIILLGLALIVNIILYRIQQR
ncbi:MAG: ABC transporter permease [Chloroflexota bacterium]|nr:ABC transporter permease [Chloroflexota bacterium]